MLEHELDELGAAHQTLTHQLQPLSERLAQLEARPAGVPLRSLDPRRFVPEDHVTDTQWQLFDTLVTVTVANARQWAACRQSAQRASESSRDGQAASTAESTIDAEGSSHGCWATDEHQEVTAPALAALLYGRGAAAAVCPDGSISKQLEELRLRRCDSVLRDSSGVRTGPVSCDEFERLAVELEKRLNGRQRAAMIHRLGGGTKWRELEETNGALNELNVALTRETKALRAQLAAVKRWF